MTYSTILCEVDAGKARITVHQAPVVHEFYGMAKEKGLKSPLQWRDSKFGDGRAKARD